MKTYLSLRIYASILLGIGLVLVLFILVTGSLAQMSGNLKGSPSTAPVLGSWQEYRQDAIDDVSPVAAYNSERDEFLVAWEEEYGTEVAIYARRVAGDGSPLGAVFSIAHWGTYTSTHPAVAYSPLHDKYLVVFDTDSKPSGGGTMYMIDIQEVNGDGTKGSVKTIAGNTNDQVNPAVAYNSIDDEFLVVWRRSKAMAGGEIFGLNAWMPTRSLNFRGRLTLPREAISIARLRMYPITLSLMAT
jgi:hypothetical protein